MIEAASFVIYRFLLVPLLLFFLRTTRWLLPQKIKQMFSERDHLQYSPLPSRPIMIHAASGEIEYAKPVIRELKSKFPQIPILVTYFSPSAKKLIQNFPGVDAVVPLPWDAQKEVKRFLDHYCPRAVLFSRTDVWPELSYQLNKRNIASALFSATFAENSRRLSFFSRPITRWSLSHLSLIFCVSSEDDKTLQKLGLNCPVQILGDTRYDQVLWRLNQAAPLENNKKPNSKKIFIAGSTWPQDEEVLLQALSDSVKQGWKWVLAPHEISDIHLRSVERRISDLGFSTVRYTDKNSSQNHDVLLIDKIGILADLYTWGQLAFVGGSFKDKVHSVMEPLAAGLPVLVGPFHQNNREALSFKTVQVDANWMAVECVQRAEDFVILFEKAPADVGILKGKIRSQIGASDKVVSWVASKVSNMTGDSL